MEIFVHLHILFDKADVNKDMQRENRNVLYLGRMFISWHVTARLCAGFGIAVSFTSSEGKLCMTHPAGSCLHILKT